MGQPTAGTAHPLSGGDVATPPTQSLVVSLLSIAVIAMTSLILKWVTVPSEVTVSLATASGALVPTFLLSRRERHKSRTSRIAELVSGRYRRPPVHILILAAGLLALVEWVSFFVFMLVTALTNAVSLFGAVEAGYLRQEQADSLMLNETAIGMVVVLQLAVMMVGAVVVGRFVARRVPHRPMLYAYAAILVCQGASLLVELATFTTINPWSYVAYPLVLASTMWIGVLWGCRTRALFLANRLFRRLPEEDRQAVLAMMDEAHVPERIGVDVVQDRVLHPHHGQALQGL